MSALPKDIIEFVAVASVVIANVAPDTKVLDFSPATVLTIVAISLTFEFP